MAASKKRQKVLWGMVWLCALWLWGGALLGPAQAQEPEPEQTGTPDDTTTSAEQAGSPGSILFLTETDSSSLPTVGLRVYGIAGDGQALDPTTDAITIRHNGEVVIPESAAQVPVGTLTIFLVDLTPGVEDQIDAVQGLIEQYASSGNMVEQVDYVAIYRVAESSAVQLMPPDRFYNSVRNFFVTPLATQSGPTALIDSLLQLLDQVESIKPEPALAANIVVITDGTDPVSTQARDSVAPKAASLGIPLHTVGLTNSNLNATQQDNGHAYLASLSAGSRGKAALLGDPAGINTIFETITQFHNQWLLRYTVPDPAGGTFPVEVGLLYEPTVLQQTSITFSGSTPSVTLNIPDESRILQLPDLEEPVKLSFSAEVSWLDGAERSVQQAQLLVNGEVAQEVPPNNLSNFSADISNFVFGANTVQVAIADEQGLQARSPAITLTVLQGEEQIPEELAPSIPVLRILLYCLIALAVVAALAGLVFLFLSRRGVVRTGRARRRPAPVQIDPTPPTEVYVREEAGAAAPAGPTAYLEIAQAATRLPAQIRLVGAQTRLGRSPQQSDIAFENDVTVSRLHATITWDGEIYHIYDEQSTSGTWVNDQQVVNYGLQLLDGDEIYLGKVALRFHIP
ncbi:MAG: FHA domain-containing protein [Ardenticatenaceae bacterium]|nr:FHA domain-containing protein [Anaerolineales bacterium]MCB8918676.1 FHA domain-containing protein [Ardenticatenaceae bacterium]